jgi:LCP family protein required for cell wall assembly
MALGREIDDATRAPPKPKSRARRRLKWALLITGLVVFVVVGSIAGYALYLNSQINRVGVGSLSPAATTGAEQNTENILMVGSTSRCALKVQNPAYGLCSQGVNGVNSDVVMLLHLNPTTHQVSILSIPRDLFVPNARTNGANKIDAALADGPTQLVKAIEEDFGIPIQHFVELNFDSFANVVDALGGIKMYFPEPVYDQYSGLDVTTTGCRSLNGTQALQVVRARHLQYKGPGVTSSNPAYWPQEAQSDLARIRRDHEFLRVLATAVSKKGLSNPITDFNLVAGVVGQLEVDSKFATTDMVHLVLTFHGVDAGKAPQLTLPVSIGQSLDFTYKGGDYGNVEFPSQPLDQNVVDQFLGVSAGTNTMTGHPLPAASSVSVNVLNGTGAYNQATDTADALTALGFHVAGVGDQNPVGPESETVVYYSSRSPSDVAAALKVARSLSGAVTIAFNPREVTGAGQGQVTVVTGSDFAVNSPPAVAAAPPSSSGTAAGAGAAAASPTTTTTQASSGAATGFDPPSSAVERLAPWDPRSCTPAGGEGP